MYSNRLYTPLRYPGGKARFAPFISQVMEINGLEGGHYLEPYAGGAGVALDVLFNGIATHIHINDIDRAVYDFWIAVTTYPDELLQLLHDTPVTIAEWKRWRMVMRGEIEADAIHRGFATLFMNRTNRSGILKGGVIGGQSQSGHYKLSARMMKGVLARRIELVALHASKISVHCRDAIELIAEANSFLPPKSLIYLDPPYYVKGSGLYRNFYAHEDHLQIAHLVQSRPFKRNWIVSYDNAPEICKMYSGTRRISYDLHYSAQERYRGSEVMFFSNGLRVPAKGLRPETV
jgi:DNA adenine methylase